jgi:hypothetical protein
MRILYFMLFSMLSSNAISGVRKIDSEITPKQVGTTNRITVDAWVDGKSDDNGDHSITINGGYTLTCPGGSGDSYHFQDSGNGASPWYKQVVYLKLTISNTTNGGAYATGYPARNAFAVVQETGKSVICTTRLKGIIGFAANNVSGSISGLGFAISGSYTAPAITLTRDIPNEMTLYPTIEGGGDPSCAVFEDEYCDDTDHPYDEMSDPLLIDLGQDGIHMGDGGVGINFDMNGDGDPTLMQWVQYGGNEAFLVQDLNNNGVIDNGMELFGTGTHLLGQDVINRPGLNQSNSKSIRLASAAPVLAANGFVALAQYDQPALGGNDDGIISSEDQIWSGLSLWLDDNADGVCTADEMLQLADVGITRLDIIPKQNNRQDPAGNSIPLWSWAVDENNSSHNKYKMVDVFFKTLTP